MYIAPYEHTMCADELNACAYQPLRIYGSRIKRSQEG